MFQADLLAGKRILITGGGTGLGKSMATHLLELGAEIAICGRREDVLAATVEERFVDAVRALDEGRTVDGDLNALILDAGLTWRQVALLRTMRNHLVQIRPGYNAQTINGVLLRNSAVARVLLARPRLLVCDEPSEVSFNQSIILPD